MTTHRLCKGCGNQECAIAGKDGAAYCDSFVPATNADRIRAMSDEELAEWIRNRSCRHCCDLCARSKNRNCSSHTGNCITGIIDYLQQPAEED